MISTDALYLEAPFIDLVLAAGKHVVIGMKQEARDLFQDADRLRARVPATIGQDGARTTRPWDLPELASFGTLGRRVRVVAEEQTVKTRGVGGVARQEVEEQRRVWVPDLPAAVVPAATIQRWGHARWDLETRG